MVVAERRRTTRSLRFLPALVVVLAACLLAFSPACLAASELDGNQVRYSISAKASLAQGGQMLGSWPATADLLIAFGGPDESGARKVDLSLENVDLSSIPGFGEEALKRIGDLQASLTFDANGQLIDLSVPGLIQNELKDVLAGIKKPSSERIAPRISWADSMRLIPIGTKLEFKGSIPRVGDTGGQDEVAVQVEFAGPGVESSTYEIRTQAKLDTQARPDAAGLVKGSSVKAEINARTLLDLEKRLLNALIIEGVVQVAKPEGGAIEVGLSLDAELVDITPIN